MLLLLFFLLALPFGLPQMLQFVWSLLALVIRGGYMWPPDKASQEAILDHQAMVHH